MRIPAIDDIDGKLERRSLKSPPDNNKDAAAEVNMTAEDSSFPHYKRVADYLLGTCIGEGSFAKVRVGFHRPTKEKVAIKIINKSKARKDSYVFRNLHREGKIMQMIRHPNVIQVYDILETGNNYYLVTELCAGGELIDIVTDQGSLPEIRVRKYMFQLVKAVSYLHERKIVHRDLKVENLLLDSQDNLKIIDFGLSNTLPNSCNDISSSMVTQCGSPAYAAPELLSKQTYGPKVDVWSIGIITYALLVGKLPFTVEPFHISKLCKKMMRGEMNPIPSSVTSQCQYFIRKLLSPDHNNRPTTDEVARMKWISTFQNDGRETSARSSTSSLLIDHVAGDANFRRHHSPLITMTSPLIDSSVVKEMSTSFDFTRSDVIRCVHKNQPGPELATYRLLLQKKSAQTRRKKKINRFSQSTQEYNNGQPNNDSVKITSQDINNTSILPNTDDDTTADSGITPSLETSPFLKILMPRVSDVDSINNSSRLNGVVEGHDKYQSETCEKAIPTTSDDNFEIENKNINEAKNSGNTSTSKLHLSTSPERINNVINSDDISNGRSAEVKPFEIGVLPSTENVEKKKLDNLSSPTTAFTHKTSKKPDINEMLSTMKKARQALQKRQEDQFTKRLKASTPGTLEKAASEKNQGSSNNQSTRITLPDFLTRTKENPHSDGQRSNKNKLNPTFYQTRSISQQKTQTHEPPNSPQSPYTPITRPLSHNGIMSRMDNKFFNQHRYVYNPTSPNSPHSTRDRPKIIEAKKKNGDVNDSSPSKYNSKQPNVTTILPAIVPKTKPVAMVSNQTTSRMTNGVSRFMRRSIPLSHTQHDVTNRLSLSHDHESPNLHDWRKPLDPKNAVSSKIENSYDSEYHKQVFVNKSPYNGYFVTKRTGKTNATQRPRKVISEPIAAAISYLTATKRRTFRKESSQETR